MEGAVEKEPEQRPYTDYGNKSRATGGLKYSFIEKRINILGRVSEGFFFFQNGTIIIKSIFLIDFSIKVTSRKLG